MAAKIKTMDLGTIQLRGNNIPILGTCHPRATKLKIRFSKGFDTVLLTSPPRVSQTLIQDFIDRSKGWLDDHYHPQRKFILQDGCSFSLFGTPIIIKRIKDIRKNAELKGNNLLIHSPFQKDVSQIVFEYLKRTAQETLSVWTTGYADQLNEPLESIKVKDITSRWGSCAKHNRSINLSWRLVFAPEKVARYVCAHEAAHLVEPNHSEDFWQVLATLDPHYATHRLWLRKNGHHLHAYQANTDQTTA